MDAARKTSELNGKIVAARKDDRKRERYNKNS